MTNDELKNFEDEIINEIKKLPTEEQWRKAIHEAFEESDIATNEDITNAFSSLHKKLRLVCIITGFAAILSWVIVIVI